MSTVWLSNCLDRHKGFKQLSTIEIHAFKVFALEVGVEQRGI